MTSVGTPLVDRPDPMTPVPFTVRHTTRETADTVTLELDPGRPPTASSLVLIHGFSDSADTWRPLMKVMRGGPRRALAVWTNTAM